MTYRINRVTNALGDNLLASLFVHVLNDNEIPAVLGHTKYGHLADCPKAAIDGENYIDHTFQYENSINSSIIEIAIQKFKTIFGIYKEIKNTRKFIPVKFEKIEIKPVDVVIVSKSGWWAPVRDWPYFDQLKNMLDNEKISWVDVIEKNIQDNEFLNYVAQSKVFITVETGAAHFASQFATKKNSILIQSGYSNSDFWCFYDYDIVSNFVECQPCFIMGDSCKKDHICMRKIQANQIFDKVMEKIKCSQL
jgi:hypothetical protein